MALIKAFKFLEFLTNESIVAWTNFFRFRSNTIENIEKTIAAFEAAGLRNRIKLLAGGAAVTKALADEMNADGYGKDAIACVEKAKELLGITSNRAMSDS